MATLQVCWRAVVTLAILPHNIGSTQSHASSYHESALELSVTIANMTFDLSVATHLTHVTLPNSTLQAPAEVMVKLKVITPSRMPTTVDIQNRIEGQVYYYFTCERVLICERQIQYNALSTVNRQAEIVIVLNFDNQKLDPIHITQTLTLQSVEEPNLGIIPSSGMTWLSVPGDVLCMNATDAYFNWTHNVKGPINIAWTYKGTPGHPELTYIMGFSDNSTYIPLGDRHDRLGYINAPGSAAMILKNVTSADDGIYEAKVVDLSSGNSSTQPFYMTSKATLTMISECALAYSVTIGVSEFDLSVVEKFDLSVVENGTNSTLPEVRVTLPAKLVVSIEVNQSAPQPKKISIQNRAGTIMLNYHTCEDMLICQRTVDFILPFIKSAKITNIIDFNIQNLELVLAHQTFIVNSEFDFDSTLFTEKDPTTIEISTTPSSYNMGNGMKIGLAVGGSVLIAVIAILGGVLGVFYKKKKPTKRDKDSPRPSQAESESSTLAEEEDLLAENTEM